MSLPRYLEYFAREQGLGDWQPEDDGRYLVTFDGSLDVQIELIDRSKFVLRSVLAPEPRNSEQAEALFRRLLRVSLAQWHHHAETVALDQERQEILIYLFGNAEEMDYASFSATVEEFVNRLEFWHGRLRPEHPPASPFSMVTP